MSECVSECVCVCVCVCIKYVCVRAHTHTGYASSLLILCVCRARARACIRAYKYFSFAYPGYDFANPGSSSSTGHFTQVVWHETTHVGMARSPCGCFVVANYWPPGNWMMRGEFEANVQRPEPVKYLAFKKKQEDEEAEAAKANSTTWRMLREGMQSKAMSAEL